MPIEDWRRVGKYVALRRGELGFRQEEAAQAAQVGITTWRLIEKGELDRYRPLIVAAVAKVLQWPADMLPRIAAGEDPPIGESGLAERVTALEDRMGKQEAKVDEILRRLSGAAQG